MDHAIETRSVDEWWLVFDSPQITFSMASLGESLKALYLRQATAFSRPKLILSIPHTSRTYST
jgi:hypothetical protein